MPDLTTDVLIIGGGVAGRSAAIFTARHGLETTVVTAGSPLLARNAHLENYPGFPAGVNSRQLLELMGDQLTRVGAAVEHAEVAELRRGPEAFRAETASSGTVSSGSVIAATKNTVEYLTPLDGVEILDRGKSFVETDGRGRTGVDGLYAAGRLAQKPHQAVVAAGHGAEVAVTLLEDREEPFYHDWVAPTGYFTGRDREVPPGCEEIEETERRRRERASMDTIQEAFADPHPDQPEQHPSVAND
ncbi:MAG: FAD-dependent oxidoreductase [Halobacteriales archaeon]